jgi:hypothetical protein
MAERPRDARFALINVAFLADPKFVKLARSTSRERFNAAVGLWLQLLCAARAGRSPRIQWDDWPDDGEVIADLRGARLLTEEGFDPESFDTWAPKKTYPSDALRKPTQGYTGLRNATTPSLSHSLSNGNGTEREKDAAEGSVVMRSEPVTPEAKAAEIEKQRSLLSHPHPAVARAARKALDKLEAQ